MSALCRNADTGAGAETAPVVLYEQEELGAFTGGALRPGGIGLTGELLRLCAFAPGSAVLDVGCGPGHSLALMATEFGLRPEGLDPSAAMLARAARRAPSAVLHRGVAAAIPCADGTFAGVVSECVLSLTGDIRASLVEMHRVLRPGGQLILTDIYCRKPWQRPDPARLHSCLSHARPLETIASEVTGAGFSLTLLRDRSELLAQLAGQLIFSCGSLERFWGLFLDAATARSTSCALAAAPLGYYALIAAKEP
ncbi:DVU_1556 family methyltransferase [Desulfobulbus sp.]|uniref:DVU_1556 family methyltransferase n=1 Tax=Desulfobulbus sp. TaxID=895 RepID=UPI00286F51CC|nr:methyltransferase domain-containing protein [Desulfobulbus sp.]